LRKKLGGARTKQLIEMQSEVGAAEQPPLRARV
jgi:hypothetical protein